MKFKIGDFIKPNALSDRSYSITNTRNMEKGIVLLGISEDVMRIKVLECKTKPQTNSYYDVKCKCFDLY